MSFHFRPEPLNIEVGNRINQIVSRERISSFSTNICCPVNPFPRPSQCQLEFYLLIIVVVVAFNSWLDNGCNFPLHSNLVIFKLIVKNNNN